MSAAAASDEVLTPPFPNFGDAATEQERVRGHLLRLGANPPQVLLFEGGNNRQRHALALYWAALLNCEGTPDAAPCLSCHQCSLVGAKQHRDLLFLDGRLGAIKIDAVRQVRQVMGEPPRGGGKRVVVLFEAQAVLPEAANVLLKSMEEPRPGTVFVMTAPQREKLLPTLVSRSFVLTLSWPDPLKPQTVESFGSGTEAGDEAPSSETPEAPAREWLLALENFARTGRDWFHRTLQKESADKRLAEHILVEARRDLLAALTDSAAGGLGALALERGGAQGLARLESALDLAGESLAYGVTPTLVLDWLAVDLAQRFGPGR